MGQYHYICNLDKREYLHPHQHNDGLKLMEFGRSGGGGTMTALAVLLSASNGRGGGDYRGDDDFPGRWAGDRIAIIGDYEKPTDVPGFTDKRPADTPWTDEEFGEMGWTCISAELNEALNAAGEGRMAQA